MKRSFLKRSAARLCVFYGPQRAKEVILSHMITFLNDKVRTLQLIIIQLKLRGKGTCTMYMYMYTYMYHMLGRDTE